MFAYKWTPLLGLVFGALIAAGVVWLFEQPARPLTTAQLVLLFGLSCLPGLGLAMLIDPQPRRVKKHYLQFDFYRDAGAKEAATGGGSEADGS